MLENRLDQADPRPCLEPLSHCSNLSQIVLKIIVMETEVCMRASHMAPLKSMSRTIIRLQHALFGSTCGSFLRCVFNDYGLGVVNFGSGVGFFG